MLFEESVRIFAYQTSGNEELITRLAVDWRTQKDAFDPTTPRELLAVHWVVSTPGKSTQGRESGPFVFVASHADKKKYKGNCSNFSARKT